MSADSKKAMLELAWGSRSIRSVFFFFRAMAAARLMPVVVFPTPPFWLAIVRMAVIVRPGTRAWAYTLLWEAILPRECGNPPSRQTHAIYSPMGGRARKKELVTKACSP